MNSNVQTFQLSLNPKSFGTVKEISTTNARLVLEATAKIGDYISRVQNAQVLVFF